MPEETAIIVLPLPARVLSPNYSVGSRGGRMKKAAAAKRYRRIAMEALMIETAPWQLASVEVTFYHKHKRRRDQDNAMGSLKAAYDGIIDAGLVVDDDYEHLKRMPPEFEIDKDYPRVELTIKRKG